MRRARRAVERCAACRLHSTLCLCDERPSLDNQTPVVLLLHQLEVEKPTNTGRLAAACLRHSEIRVRGAGQPVATGPLWPADHHPLLLYPAPGAVPVDQVVSREHGPFALIVPDGTWSQAARTVARVPALADCTPVTPPPGPASRYRLRSARGPDMLCTLEAIARTLASLEGPRDGPALRAALERILDIMVERTLWSRGALRDHEVTGGVPEPARRRRAEAGRQAPRADR